MYLSLLSSLFAKIEVEPDGGMVGIFDFFADIDVFNRAIMIENVVKLLSDKK
jgi:hypothetical protein